MKKKIIGALIGVAIIPVCALVIGAYMWLGIPIEGAGWLGLLTVCLGVVGFIVGGKSE